MNGVKSKLITLLAEQRGITGLETAIVLIAFVVVASVFAFTVLLQGYSLLKKHKKHLNQLYVRRNRHFVSLGRLLLVDHASLVGPVTNSPTR